MTMQPAVRAAIIQFLTIWYIFQHKCHDTIHHCLPLTGQTMIILFLLNCFEIIFSIYNKPCVLSASTQDCVSWQPIGTVHTLNLCCHRELGFLTGSTQSSTKQRWNFFPFPRFLCLINSSEWAWTWVRSQKRQYFLNVGCFIPKESQCHGIEMLCPNVDNHIMTKNFAIHRCIGVSLQQY